MLFVSAIAMISLRASRSSATGKTVCRLENSPRHELQRHRVDHDLREIHALQAELLGQGIAQRRLGHEAQIYEELSDGLMGLELFEQRDPELILVRIPCEIKICPIWRLACGETVWALSAGNSLGGLFAQLCTRSRAWAGVKLAARFSVKAALAGNTRARVSPGAADRADGEIEA